MFGTLFKDVTGSKTNHGSDTEAIDGKASFEELSKNFAVFNFPTQMEGSANSALENEILDMDIGKPCYSWCVWI